MSMPEIKIPDTLPDPTDIDNPFSVKYRIETCQNCEFLNRLKQCKKCNCFMPVKVRIPSVSCPINKWHAIPKITKQDMLNSRPMLASDIELAESIEQSYTNKGNIE